MEVFDKGSNYPRMVKIAELVGIDANGVKKPVLAEKLNAKVAELGEEEFAKIIAQVDSGAAPVTQGAVPSADTGTSVSASAGAKGTKAGRVASTVSKEQIKKWYEAGFPYQENDLVDVTGGVLKNRQMRITRPAPGKTDAAKGHIINMKDGSLQGTEVTIDLVNLHLADDQANVRLTPPKQPKAQVTATPEVKETPETPAEMKEEKAETV